MLDYFREPLVIQVTQVFPSALSNAKDPRKTKLLEFACAGLFRRMWLRVSVVSGDGSSAEGHCDSLKFIALEGESKVFSPGLPACPYSLVPP